MKHILLRCHSLQSKLGSGGLGKTSDLLQRSVYVSTVIGQILIRVRSSISGSRNCI